MDKLDISKFSPVNKERFDDFISNHTYTADFMENDNQVHFIRNGNLIAYIDYCPGHRIFKTYYISRWC